MAATSVSTDSFDRSLGRLPLEVNVIVTETDRRQSSDLSVDEAVPTEVSVLLERGSGTTTGNELCETKDERAEDQCEEIRIILPGETTPEERGIMTEKRTTNKTYTGTLTKRKAKQTGSNQTLNIFLNDLYNKKLDLNIKYSNQEIADIYNAVINMVNKLAKTIGEIDPQRLSIGEVISVGSAREGTQIIRPCEYDFILTLDVLSKQGVVSVTEAIPDDTSRQYMRVKIEDSEIRALFHDVTDDGYIRGSRSLPFFRKGLRQLLLLAIKEAVNSNFGSSETEETGNLTFKTSKIEMHGPAFTIGLIWESYSYKRNMDISIDLVPALKLDDILAYVLLKNDNINSSFINILQNVGSVLLLPRDGQCFHVTYTEAELLITSGMSEHHRKSYKLLKYMVNGEPFPLDTNETGRMKCFFGEPRTGTGIHSYALKMKVWEHHYIHRCREERDLGTCIYDILRMIQISVNTGQLLHPLTKSELIGSVPMLPEPLTDTEYAMSFHKFRKLPSDIENIRKMPIQDYNYERCQRRITETPSMDVGFSGHLLAWILFIKLLLAMVAFNGRARNILWVCIGLCFSVFVTVYTIFAPKFFRRHLLTLESRRFTKFRIDMLIVFVFICFNIIQWVFYTLLQETMGYYVVVCILLTTEFSIRMTYLYSHLPATNNFDKTHKFYFKSFFVVAIITCLTIFLFVLLGLCLGYIWLRPPYDLFVYDFPYDF